MFEVNNKFKKIYVEITNVCNLNCSFCLKTNREKRTMSFDEFKLVLSKIKPYTDYLYFHVLGEPLIHPNINEFIDEATNEGFKVNITSNGYLINNIKTNNIRQINISLHSFNESYSKSLNNYLNDLYNFSINNNKDTYINYRLWVKSKNFNKIINFLEDKYNTKIDLNLKNIILSDNIYLNFDNEFIWPENNENNIYEGYCHALTDHMAILSNGVVTACCLDGGGKINLGNIFNDNLEDILSSKLYLDMKENFKNGKRIHPLCQKCNFLSIKDN